MKKNYTISISRARFWTVFLPLAILTMMVGGIIGAVIVDRIIMPQIVGVADRGDLLVPDLAGKQYEDARQELYAIGLRLETNGHEYNELPKGVIINQQTPAGEKVKKGRFIGVTTSDGPEVAQIPSMDKLNERLARKALREAGFENVLMRKVYDEECPKDLVVGSEPPSGVQISREMQIEVKLSNGPRPTSAKVPNLIGEMLSEAKKLIEDNGLLAGTIEYRSAAVSQSGTIISQSVPPGTNVPLETTINLIVAGGK